MILVLGLMVLVRGLLNNDTCSRSYGLGKGLLNNDTCSRSYGLGKGSVE